jgi:hypothetical protein
MGLLNKYKIVLNDKTNLQTGLNEIYHELDFLINQIQEEYTKLSENTSLADMSMDDKSEYAKSVHNLLVDKANVMKLKIEVQKIVTEVLKTGGNEISALNNMKSAKSVGAIDTKSLQKWLTSANKEIPKETETPNEVETMVYNL